MPQSIIPAAATGLPITRAQIEQHVQALIDLLDTLDPDADAEPSLGYSAGGLFPENEAQTGPSFHMAEDAGADLEDEHDGAEPSEDSEPSLSWTEEGCLGHPFSWTSDLEGSGDYLTPRMPTGRKMAEPVVIPMSLCLRVSV